MSSEYAKGFFHRSNTMQPLRKSFSAFSHQSQIPSATLSMEVSYIFHSHLIGRAGKNINRVMEDTGTRIHFPDCNRIAGEFKRNSVVVRGPIANLENARQRIRADIPVEFIVDCNMERVNSIGESSLSDYFSKTFGVLMRFYPKIDGVSCQVNIRGQQDRLQLLKDAVTYFGRVTHTPVDSVVMKVETSFDHVWIARDHIDKIITATGAGIRCPDVSVLKELPKKYCVWIRGSMDQVYMASSMLNGLLPMQLMVQVPSDRFNRHLLGRAQNMDVMFHVELSTSDILTIRLTSYEWNTRNLFDVLKCCLELPNNVAAVIPSLSPTWLALADITQHSSFLQASQKLLSLMSSSNNGNVPQQSSTIAMNVPRSVDTSSPDSSTTNSSPRYANESSIPASLAASRFDQNSSRHLSQFLEAIGLSHYSDLFIQNEIDLAMFTTLKDEDLLSIGIRSFGARKMMLNAVQELRR
ncbi:protein bicaudal C homolog 1-like isoform X2 [Daphnia pulicaria]|uniref:protein bicaudal C homolog 1-like isoform X2 n=1 Tax=Daphnia pulicaria TaxID=35523 RepID=UPI001EECDE6E|nr:protein bicaudal C homolog 1-like isoform X2 [Daphnia pulicaria]